MICEKGSIIPAILYNQPILNYSFDLTDEATVLNFEDHLISWINEVLGRDDINVVGTADVDVFIDARRLYEKREYSACIVACFSTLESLIQIQVPLRSAAYKRNEVYKDIYLYHWKASLDKGYTTTVKDFLSLRNKVAHLNYKATRSEAKDCLHFVETIYEQFLLSSADNK